MKKEIEKKRKNRAQIYNDLITFDWISFKNATQIVTSFILKMEDDEMRIEHVFMELFKTVTLLKNENTLIATDLMDELENTYTKNVNLVVPLSAFLLSPSRSNFWRNYCSDRYRSFFLSVGWIGIVYFCCLSGITVTICMHDCFIQHLLYSHDIQMDTFDYWQLKKNELSEIALRILSIPCSESERERLF